MSVKQISIFLENKSGELSEVCNVLAAEEISLQAMSLADTSDYGILRIIVPDAEAAVAALRGAGYVCKITDVLAVEIPNRPGGMQNVLATLSAANIGVDYAYAFISHKENFAHVILRTDHIGEAAAALNAAGIHTLDMEELLS